jgi:hypothetical protein
MRIHRFLMIAALLVAGHAAAAPLPYDEAADPIAASSRDAGPLRR